MKTSATSLKTHLGRFMRAVRAGQEVVVTDREEPVAKLVPYRANNASNGLVVVQPAATNLRFEDVKIKPVRYKGPSATELLREDRDSR